MGAVDAIELSCVLCGHCLQNDWASRATNLHQILQWAWIFLHRNYSDDSKGHSYGQLVIGSFIIATCPLMYHILCRFFHETSSYPGDSVSLQPRFGAMWLLAFPKTIITFERGEISDWQWDSGKYDRGADGDWKNCVRSKGAYFEGDWNIIVLCTMFLVPCIFLNKCLYFFILHGWISLDINSIYVCVI